MTSEDVTLKLGGNDPEPLAKGMSSWTGTKRRSTKSKLLPPIPLNRWERNRSHPSAYASATLAEFEATVLPTLPTQADSLRRILRPTTPPRCALFPAATFSSPPARSCLVHL